MICLNDSNFDDEVIKSNLPVMVDLYGSWCKPCQRLVPILDELAEIYKGKLKIYKIDVDENHGIADRYGVMSVPTVIIFKEGKVVKEIMGYHDIELYKLNLDKICQ